MGVCNFGLGVRNLFWLSNLALFTHKLRGHHTQYNSFYSMALKLQHPFTLIAAGPNASVGSTFMICLLECNKELCDTV